MSLDSYKNRVTGSIGSSLKEYVKGQVRTNLDTFLAKSQYGMDVEINGEANRIGIMTGAMTDTRDEVLVLSKLNVLQMGTLFKWEDEYWVVVKREARVIKESFYGTAYRCNVDLKWVDKDGVLKSQKAYAKGRGLSSILVENKYTDPPVISREVDTPVTVITQRNLELEQDMRFLFNGQPYRVTFVDNLSTDGTTILGMYDDILQDGDDILNNVANYNNHYSIELGFDTDVILPINQTFTVTYSVLNNGNVDTDRTIVLTGDADKVTIDGMNITPISATDIVITASLLNNDLIYTQFTVHAGEEWIEDNVFIVGSDKISWNNTETYKLNNNTNTVFNLDWSDARKVKHTEVFTDNSISISVKDKYSGVIHMTAINDTDIIQKDIEIISVEGI